MLGLDFPLDHKLITEIEEANKKAQDALIPGSDKLDIVEQLTDLLQ